MRTFHTLVFNETLESTATLFTESELDDVLASADELSIFAVTDTVSGTTPTLTVRIQEGPDQIQWSNKAATAEINAVALSPTAVTTAVGRDSGAVPSNGFVRLSVSLGGTNPRAHVRIWVTGRSDS